MSPGNLLEIIPADLLDTLYQQLAKFEWSQFILWIAAAVWQSLAVVVLMSVADLVNPAGVRVRGQVM